MVAYTAGSLLPYQVDTDAPCDAPQVWCEFVERLDGLVTAMNQDAARLSPSVPVAKMLRTTAFTSPDPFGLPVPFEATLVDTDGMVDPAQSVFHIRPRRIGTYKITAMMQIAEGSTLTNQPLSLFITKGFVEITLTSSSFDIVAEDAQKSTGDSTSIWLNATTEDIWTVENLESVEPGYGVLLQVGNEDGIVQRAELAVCWSSDRVDNS